MIFKRIINDIDINYKLTWESYSSNFPHYEKRLISDHRMAIADKRFYANAIYEKNTYIGFIFYWMLDSYIFVEHFAIEKAFRNKNYGSHIINKLIEDNSNLTIILEIDPPIDEMSIRRLSFYKKLGFVNNSDITHYNLPYQNDLKAYRLDLLSSKVQLNKSEYKSFLAQLRSSACIYCQK